MKDTHVLVTGANGLVGHHLCQRLLEADFSVTALSRSAEPALLASLKDHPNLKVIRGDITDRDFLETLFRSHRFQVVFHLAVERYFPKKDDTQPPLFLQETSAYQTNYEGTLNLLQSATRHQSPIWIQSSAMMVFDITRPSPAPIDELQSPAPVEENGMSVHLAEQACHYIGRITGLKYVILRYPGIYGSGKDNGAIANFARRCLQGDTTPIVAPNDRKSDFIYVEDVVNANMQTMKAMLSGDEEGSANNLNGGTYHIGSGAATSVAEVAKTIRQLTKSKIEIIDQPSGHSRQFSFNIEAARRDLGFQPGSLKEGLTKYLEKLEQ